MRNRWRFVGVHVVLALALMLLLGLYHFSGPRSSVGYSLGFGAWGTWVLACATMPFLAGLIAWAVLGRTNDAPAPGFGLRYIALTIVALMFVMPVAWIAGFLGGSSNAALMAIILAAPTLVVVAALLSLRRWNLFSTATGQS